MNRVNDKTRKVVGYYYCGKLFNSALIILLFLKMGIFKRLFYTTSKNSNALNIVQKFNFDVVIFSI